MSLLAVWYILPSKVLWFVRKRRISNADTMRGLGVSSTILLILGRLLFLPPKTKFSLVFLLTTESTFYSLKAIADSTSKSVNLWIIWIKGIHTEFKLVEGIAIHQVNFNAVKVFILDLPRLHGNFSKLFWCDDLSLTRNKGLLNYWNLNDFYYYSLLDSIICGLIIVIMARLVYSVRRTLYILSYYIEIH